MESYTDLRRYLLKGNAYLNSLGLQLTRHQLITRPFHIKDESIDSHNHWDFHAEKRFQIVSLRRGRTLDLLSMPAHDTNIVVNILNGYGARATAKRISVYWYGYAYFLYIKYFESSWVIGCYCMTRGMFTTLPFESKARPY